MYADPAQVTQSNCAVLTFLSRNGLNEHAYLGLFSESYQRKVSIWVKLSGISLSIQIQVRQDLVNLPLIKRRRTMQSTRVIVTAQINHQNFEYFEPSWPIWTRLLNANLSLKLNPVLFKQLFWRVRLNYHRTNTICIMLDNFFDWLSD